VTAYTTAIAWFDNINKKSRICDIDIAELGSLAAISIIWKAHGFASLAFAKFAFVAMSINSHFMFYFVLYSMTYSKKNQEEY